MNITIFAKKAQTNDGKAFYRYLSTLTDKQGKDYPVQVKFRESCGSPNAKDCPMNIVVEKQEANLVVKEYTKEDTGEVRQSRTLWVTHWVEGEPYVDTSLDDFE